MINLFIDSTSNRLVFAIVKNDSVLIKAIMTDKNMTELFVSELDSFLKTNLIEFKDIKNLYMINGPGNFSGVRIGCVFANTISILANIDLYYLSSCQFQKTSNKQISIIDAKSNKFYALIDNEIEMISMEEIQEIAKNKNFEVMDNYLNYDFEACWEYNKNNFIKTNKIEANYIKKPI